MPSRGTQFTNPVATWLQKSDFGRWYFSVNQLDPQQLPPTVVSNAALKNKYEQSLFQRLMKASPNSISLLSIQYRMHPEISLFPGQSFYKSKITDADAMFKDRAIDWHQNQTNLFPPYIVYNVYRGRESTGRAHSRYNLEEVDVCVNLVRSIAENYPSMNVNWN